MKKRILKISALCLAIVLIVGVCWFANGLVGNPISKTMARNAAEKYLETNPEYYRLEKDEDAKIRGLHAATMLAGRFNPNGNFLRAWSVNNRLGDEVTGYAIIDCMLNLPLLYWATELTNDPRYAAIAKLHADTAMKEFVKPDGSVYHIVNLHPHSEDYH